MNYLLIFLYIIFAFLPSAVWLFFYISKDHHPEPKNAIFRIFFLGIGAGAIVYIFTTAFYKYAILFWPILASDNIWALIIKYFLIVAFVEELAKYLIAKKFIEQSPYVDEPLDIVLYIVVSALGFAALENFLLIFNFFIPSNGQGIFEFSLMRFAGATFLHTLASFTFGFFIALSFYYLDRQKKIFFIGLCTAVLLHGLYNIAVVGLGGFQQIMAQLIILSVSSAFVFWGFVKLKNMKSICRVHIKE